MKSLKEQIKLAKELSWWKCYQFQMFYYGSEHWFYTEVYRIVNKKAWLFFWLVVVPVAAALIGGMLYVEHKLRS